MAEIRDIQLSNLFTSLIKDVFPKIKPALDKRWVKNKHEYPNLTFNSNGMPNISKQSYSAPVNIGDLFMGFGGKADIELKELVSFNELYKYLLIHDRHREVAYPDQIKEESKALSAFGTITHVFITDFIERYYHLSEKEEFDLSLFDSIYIPIENFMFSTNLNFDISLPILFMHFGFDELVLNENLLIRRITNENHKARFGVRSFAPPISDVVISAATHEVVFRNYNVKRGKRLFDNALSNENAYPIADFELFFNAIKIVTNFSTGFAQIIVHPLNWADIHHTNLPVLHGLSIKKYPNYFDDFYWNSDSLPCASEAEMKSVGEFYDKLLSNSNNKVKIANKRFRSSYLRGNEDDSIIDIIIALEILLSDSEKGEITHKLALRIARLISIHNSDYDAQQMFDAVKKIYAFRSSLVHGSSRNDTKKEIRLHETSNPISMISLANNFLREVLKVLLENPKYIDIKQIDRLLLYS